jgi:hypothetical protein
MQTLVALAPAISAIVATVVAFLGILTLVKAVVEYVGQNKLKRYEKYQEMSRRFDENSDIAQICELVIKDSPELANISKYRKEVVICFFEEVAVLNNSRILPKNLIVNSFGYYAIKCYESKFFWSNLDKHGLFTGFCEEMLSAKKKITLEDIRSIGV